MHKRKTKRRSAIFMAGVMSLSIFSAFTPAVVAEEANHEDETVNTAEENDGVPDGHLRVHYDYGDLNLEELGVWFWGDVVDAPNDWPNGKWFEDYGTTDFGAYVDIELEENAEEMGFLINNRGGNNVTEDDFNVEILAEDMDEVWLTHDEQLYLYEPLDLPDNILRVHFEKDGDSYEPWGLWTWGHVANPTSDWPTGAHPFSNDQTGPYGAYIDLELTDDASSIGFLLVNRENGEEQTTDFSFGDFDQHNQIFLHLERDEVYTNPYYVATDVEEEPELKEGEYDFEISGTTTGTLDAENHAVLDIDVNYPDEDVSIRRMSADVTELGGPEELSISPEVMGVTLSAHYTIDPGTYEIPLQLVDEEGGVYEGTAEVEVVQHAKEDGDFYWDESVIYFMLTDRFYDGDPSNNDPYNLDYSSYDNQRGTPQGGDFVGVTENLDYLDELGVNTIWITPIVENIAYDVSYANENDGSYFGYHGYWAKDFEELNPHLGTLDEFHDLIDAAADRDMEIMVDVVLNHPGYGLKPEDGDVPEGERPDGYPTDNDRERFEGMIREQSGSTDETMELADLPDFKTEVPEVREQIVDWQTGWIQKSTTDAGNAISSFRVDTVKHVDVPTWQLFKNELTRADAGFKMIGEAWENNINGNHRYLNSGQMDSLLDFQFKSAAGNLVNGNINAAVDYLDEIQHTLDNKATVGNFLGSHDENGFLYTQGGDEGKLKVAASLQAFAKGQPVIYYGEELGQTGADNWPQYDNRYDMGWDIVENNDILAHYQSVFNLRGEHSEVMARGAFDHVAGSSEDDFVVFSRTYGDNSVFAALNVMEEARAIMLDVDSDDVVVTDHYAGEEYTAADGTVTIDVPAMADGGTAVLTVENGTILGAEETEEETDTNEIPENHLRVHYDAGDTAPSNLGVWYWDGAARASEEFSSWPGEERFSEDRMTDFGPYFDIELEEGAQRLDMLVNNVGGANLTGDVAIDILSPNMNEIWLYEDGTYLTYEPVDLDDQVRIHYDREDADYDDWAVWFWEQGLNPPENWPDEAANFEAEGRYGAYVDIDLEEDAEEIGFLLLNAATDEQTGDMHFDELQQHKQIFVTEGDDTAYNNPYYVSQEGLRTAEVLSNERIELIFSSTDGFDVDTLREGLTITDRHGENVAFDSISIEDDGVTVNVYGSFDLDAAPFEVQFNERTATAIVGWRLKDEMYAYDGDLGAELHEDGSATLKLWSPSADNVNIILYDRDDQYDVVTDDVAMDLGDRGVWSVTLDENNAGVADLDGYYYHYEIERDGETVLALDPYAKSMATWNSNDGDNNYIGKAAIVDPSAIGPELDFAEIDGFEKREDAIIYELHVRDFTSDPSIEDELENEFGTFGAFAERLDYLEDMGVTHVQLLPVMSYFFANEYEASERMLDYASTQTNFNWGYDPHSYFSLTGMYSQDPDDAAKRIEEFKMLIDEIHSRDMGVILDVVYNHTARVRIFEDLEPNYYHFMDADGTPRVSFGGGRLGTTHEMARRILVDSIMHWVEEYKVDGFRFDMMGDHDAESIQIAYDKAKEVNPNIVMIGEGWRTFVGDEMYPDVQPADQDWMEYTESVGSFSDDFRNELKSGFGSEGEPRFITGGERDIQQIFDNLTANPHNFTATNPGDVVPYIAAHDNLTLHDVIAQSIQKDPKDHQEEIHQRIRLGNLMTLTAQGTSFLHAGQEFGRTKQFKHEDYREPVADNAIPYKSTFMTDEDGNPFEYPYFIHDSYDSSDAVNLFDWEKATNAEEYPINVLTRDFTRGMIELRRSTDAFRLGTMEEIEENVSFIDAPEVGERDLLIGYHAVSTDNTGEYFVFVNADDEARTMTLDYDLTDGTVIVDADEAGATEVSSPAGFELSSDSISIEPLTAVVVKKGSEESPEEPLEIPYKDGDEGEEIREMKLKLTELGFGNFPAIPSDRFGSVTKGVVEHFQEYYGLEVTGEADQATLDLMDSILTSVYTDGNEASEVRQLKLNLTALGFGNFPANPSPRYGPVTMRVVSEFQEAHGLVVNGIADPVTLAKIDELTLSVPFKDGDEGPAIKLMKQDLTKLGFGNFPANPSERYGPVTEGVVSSFQTYYGLDVTGEADQETLDLISELLTSVYTDGNSAPEIRQLKVDLSALGFGNFPVNPSQNYGPVTMGVVSDFQEANDLAINGIADPVTLAKIAELSMVIPYEHGDTGKAIKIMKQHLTLLGFGSFPSDPSELFGPVTSSVVVSFQDYYGLDQTGVADQETLAYINDIFTSVFTDGNSAPEIRELKLNLTELGYGNFPSDPSENYGPVTSGVVRDFQEANDLAVNGIADAVTLQKIEELTQ